MSKPFLTQSGVPDTKLNPPFNPGKNKNTAGIKAIKAHIL